MTTEILTKDDQMLIYFEYGNEDDDMPEMVITDGNRIYNFSVKSHDVVFTFSHLTKFYRFFLLLFKIGLGGL